ncbi:MAG: hypothetical protein KAR06_01420 [Deltaproteobacteria bacterium]|nr:hypothetical protein [Deltaproteobacteria bacterium]
MSIWQKIKDWNDLKYKTQQYITGLLIGLFFGGVLGIMVCFILFKWVPCMPPEPAETLIEVKQVKKTRSGPRPEFRVTGPHLDEYENLKYFRIQFGTFLD